LLEKSKRITSLPLPLKKRDWSIFKADAKNALARFLSIFYIIFKNVDFLRVINQLDFL